LLHAIRKIDKKYDNVLLLQLTQPLRTSDHIDEAIELYINKRITSLISVSLADISPLFFRKIDCYGKLKPLLNKSSDLRRQDMEKYYYINGAIYINKINLLNEDTSLNDNEYAYVMDSKYAIDIDEPEDLKMLELLIANKLQKA
jgi:CMP-N,N'-diacetyllegionaminic acid synthase